MRPTIRRIPAGVSGVSHTPGPWVADSFCMERDRRVRVGTTDGTPLYYHRTVTICECAVGEPGDEAPRDPPVLVAEANARLIALAPDLLDALIGMVGLAELVIPTLAEPQRSGVADNHRLVAAREAIARATGGAQ